MKSLLLILLFLVTLPARAGDLPSLVLQALKAAQIPLADVAVVVQPLDAGTPLLAYNPDRPMNPASVMKLVTTYAALDLLGPAYTWKTGAYIDAEPMDGRLPGNLYIKGSGDPKFALEHFWALLRQVRLRGISQIAGDVVLDRSAFDVPTAKGDFDDKPLRPYNVGPDALLVNFRALRFLLQPEGIRVRLLTETPGDNLTIDNRLQLAKGECGDDWKDRIVLRITPENSGNRLEFTGSYSAQCGEKVLSLAPLPADAQIGSLFNALWKEMGGSLTGRVRAGALPVNARLVAEQESPLLAETVRDINKFSNNVMARQLFLTLGNDAGTATLDKARQRVGDWLVRRGLVFRELELENGSGLSRRERISAGSLNRLLLDAWQSPVMPEFMASLPVIGIDGTMKKRLNGSTLTGRGHIKTGTLEGVKTAAGYVLDSRGRRYAVTFLINHPRARYGQEAIDALLLWITDRGINPTPPAAD